MTVDPLGGFDSSPSAAKRPAAVRARSAATLIVLRRDGPKPRLLMGRRNKGVSFMPGMWVFPGGRLDRSDFGVPHLGDLKPETERRLRHGLSAPRAKAIALAAIRETFEETGLILGKAAPPRSRAGVWGEYLRQGALPDISQLDMIARAVTPPHLPKRFDARFLLAPAEVLLSLEPREGCGELDEIAWVDLDEALALELPGITRFVVRDVAERIINPDRPAMFMRFVNRRSKSSAI